MPFDFDGLVGSVADAVKASLRGVLDGAFRVVRVAKGNVAGVHSDCPVLVHRHAHRVEGARGRPEDTDSGPGVRGAVRATVIPTTCPVELEFGAPVDERAEMRTFVITRE